MKYDKLKDMAELISAFLVCPLPVYLMEEYVNTGNPIRICSWIKAELKPGINYYPIDIVEKVVSIYE